MSSQKLIKVAKEFNVGLHSIADTLRKKGFEIEEKPMADVSDEMYAVLRSEYKLDLETKKQADQMARPVAVARPNIALPSLSPSLPPMPPKPAVTAIFEEKPKPVAPPVVVEKPVEKVPEKVAEIPAPEKTVETTPEKVVEKFGEKGDVITASDSAKGRIGLNVVGKIDLNPPKPVPKPVERSAPKFVAPKPVERTPSPTVEEKIPSKPEVWTAKALDPEPITPIDPEDAVIRAKGEELRGLRVLGKVDLNKFKPPPPEPRGNNRGNERDRRSGSQNQGGGQGQNRPQGTGTGERPRFTPAGQSGSQGSQDRRNQQGGGNQQSGERRKRVTITGQPVTADSVKRSIDNARESTGFKRDGRLTVTPAGGEVSKKLIDEKIRQTMAQLGGGNRSNRQKIRRSKLYVMREKAELAEQLALEGGLKLQVTEFISASDLAGLLAVNPAQVVSACFSLGVIVGINQRLDAEVIELIAGEFGREVQFISAEEQVEVVEDEIDDPADLRPRQPIVVVMGHVDHGKTSLLDFIRKATVASGEAGGITQHIGAYEVAINEDRKISFLDTPGHEAFTAMRARGAKVTDVAIIVISADDSIMPQTREAISHAQAAGVKMIFAINKIDKPGADPERIKNELSQMNLLVEDWGGTYQSQDISAKLGTNVDKLLEKVLLEADLLDLQANPKRRAYGTILEASLEKGRGYVSKILIQNGTLREGDPILAGEHSGKVKAMFNEHGKRIKFVGPAQPALVLGLVGAPQAGENIKVTHDEAEARTIASKRAQIIREQQTRSSRRISLDEIGRRLALGTFKELKLIVKGDVDGSVEALTDSLLKLSAATIQVNVIHKAVGQIVESDILLASASDAIVIGFNVRPSLNARKLAEKEGVEIKNYSIIYTAIDEIKAAMEGMLEPTKEEEVIGQVEIREVYKITKIGTVAGCLVQEGKVTRNSFIRIIRDGIVTYPMREGVNAKLGSLKRFKEDAKEVKSGFECGLTIENFNDMKVGDMIEVYEIRSVKQTL